MKIEFVCDNCGRHFWKEFKTRPALNLKKPCPKCEHMSIQRAARKKKVGCCG